MLIKGLFYNNELGDDLNEDALFKTLISKDALKCNWNHESNEFPKITFI